MYVIRDVVRCKPGKAGEIARRLKLTLPSTEAADGFRNSRVLVAFVTSYWTVMMEAEVENLAHLENHMLDYGSRPEFREAMTGYADLVEEGHREIYRVV